MGERGNQTVRVLKGMNLDVAREYIKDQASFLKNCITDYISINAPTGAQIQSGENHNVGIITPVEGASSTEDSNKYPAGQNVCSGSKYDRRLNQFFYFLWNSNNDHTLWVYDLTNINAQGATVGGGTLVLQSSELNFDLHHLVTSIDIVIADVSGGLNVQNLQRLIYFTDGFNPPRKLNVDVALAGGYGALTNLRSTDEFINAVKYPPLDVDVTTTLPNPDPTYKLNFVANKQFQFGAQYYYQDGEHTTRGAISTFAYNVSSVKNFIELTIGAGSSLVTYVVLYYRLGNTGDWKQFIKIPRSVIVANVLYPYDAGTNTFKFKFFNNIQYNVVDQEDINRLFDLVPQKAFAEKYVQQNLLLYGNILEGYNNLDAEELAKPTFTFDYNDFAPLTLTVDGNINYSWTGAPVVAFDTVVFALRKTDYQTGITTNVATYNVVYNTASPLIFSTPITDIDYGDIVWLEILGTVYTPGASMTIDPSSILTGTYSNLQSNPISCAITPFFGGFQVNNDALAQTAVAGNHVHFNIEVSDTCNTWSTVLYQHTVPNNAIGLRQLKQGGRYKFGIICYDAALRSTFVQELEDGDINIESIQENGKFQTFTITINWNNLVLPDWVYYVKVCRTKNLNVDRSFGMGYLQFGISDVEYIDYDGSVHAAPTANTKKVRFGLPQLIQYNTDYYENTTTTYTWTEGDRIQFIRNGNGTYFDFTTYGLIDEVLSTDPTAPDVKFICNYNAGLAALVDGAWVELYTPSKEPYTDIYYEIGDFIPTDRVPSLNRLTVTSTVLDTFDTYPIFWRTPYILAAVNDTGVIPFEHHSIYAEGVVPSNGEDIGRINVVNVDARQLWYPSRIRKSNAYIPNSFFNGLSTFVDDQRTDLNRSDGGIQQFADDGYKLYVMQEDRTVGLMMAKQLVTLADGGQQLVATSNFFSDPVIFQQNFGLQNPESFIETGDAMFFADTKRGAYVEFDGQKLTDIAREGSVKSYSEYKLKKAQQYNNQEYINEKCCWSIEGHFLAMDVDWYVNILFNGEYVSAIAAAPVTTTQELADLINTISEFQPSGQEQCFVSGDSICFFGGILRLGIEVTVGSILVFDDADELQDTFPLVCSVDYITLPACYNPKQKQYIQTYFNVNTKPHYAYAIGTDFETGEDIFISLDIDGVPQTATIPVTGLPDIQNELVILIGIAKAAAGLPSGTSPTDSPFLIENNTVFYIIGSIGFIYGDLIIGATTYTPDTATTQYQYINNEYGIAPYGSHNYYPVLSDNTVVVNMERAETIAWSILGRNWSSFFSFTPQFYTYCDGNTNSLAFVSFWEGQPAIHNLINTGYLFFYNYETPQVITIICNDGVVTEKRFSALALDSKDKKTSITAVKYSGYLVTTSDLQRSSIPIDALVFKENFLYTVFFRSTDLGGTLQTGQQLRGKWLEITLVRDRDASVAYDYSEFASATFWYFTSAKAIK